MNRPSYGDAQPIVAPATPLAESALAVLRCSGASSIEAVSRVFSRPDALLAAAGHSVVHGWILGKDGERIDEVLLSVFRAPRSYTGEEGVDLSCHGGIAAAKAVLAALEGEGFRRALPGEFTFRAFINGKLDLTRAESVMELVSAKTDEGRSRAADRLAGELEGELRVIRDLLVGVLAATELFLDYSEDDGVSLVAADGLGESPRQEHLEAAGMLPDRPSAEEARRRLAALAASYRMERLYGEGATVAVAGRPNAGKSSLFNRLVKEERSIVTEVPGTTRDWIEAWISLDGVPVRLVDTAGLRHADDPVERIGVARSRSLLAEADLVLYVLDGERGMEQDDADFIRTHGDTQDNARRAAPKPPLIVVWNKADLRPPVGDEFQLVADSFRPVAVSARTGEGVHALAERLVSVLEEAAGAPAGGETAPGRRGPGIATERQKGLVDAALSAVDEALALSNRGEPLDLVAQALREAVHALGEITGEVSSADILEAMFGRFCVGK